MYAYSANSPLTCMFVRCDDRLQTPECIAINSTSLHLSQNVRHVVQVLASWIAHSMTVHTRQLRTSTRKVRANLGATVSK